MQNWLCGSGRLPLTCQSQYHWSVVAVCKSHVLKSSLWTEVNNLGVIAKAWTGLGVGNDFVFLIMCVCISVLGEWGGGMESAFKWSLHHSRAAAELLHPSWRLATSTQTLWSAGTLQTQWAWNQHAPHPQASAQASWDLEPIITFMTTACPDMYTA